MTSTLQLTGLTKRFGPVTAVNQLSLNVAQGELLAVLGPSGCGKTTLLRLVAGFEAADEGEIRVGGRTVSAPGAHMAPHRRKVGVVPQEPSLFAHLSVAKNVAFGLRRGAERRAAECLELVGLGGLGERMPHELSGGQQQRVAVARALAPQPPVVLLDEPFSALDASLRGELRQDVREALAEAGSTAVLVTHDQDEALSMADRVAVMRDGEIRQIGSPAQIYREPADPWVAQFVGDAMLLPVRASGSAFLSALGEVATESGAVSGVPETDGRNAAGTCAPLALVRPEQVRLRPPGDGVPATVLRVDYHGHDALIVLSLGAEGTPGLMRLIDGPDVPVEPGQSVHVSVHGPVRMYAGTEAEAGAYTLD
ncbi:ABC transporter ATP-binding protein [Bogoriella caseilytica]|uniref:ABC-type quaternary amine transporter n=1 Tax=Bogoriella caseilytica TaxID=56055 RepID=A0A3N2B9L4_9MICO|nr:ABC transporter ATP-binding protein [Bogoriella caseilytica]ROR71950.1 iron(III) transport system ATP-binding protein [Bogoriella caseilytica]